MKFLLDFLRQEVPKPGSEMPAYYKKALTVSEVLLAVYFALSVLLFRWITHRWLIVPIALLAAVVAMMFGTGRMGVRANLFAFLAIIVAWSGWVVHAFGWGCGAQHLLVPLLVMIFFDIYEPPWLKLVLFVGLIAFRMLLFNYSLGHTALYTLDRTQSIVMQSACSLSVFVIMACICILFSTNIQATERKLRLDNQELHKEAGTDPLTQLPNRRALLDEIDQYLAAMPGTAFSVAIADIDFFKRVNDTYGHSCGDYTLRQLSNLFKESAGTSYSVCRWGGEEFCFFFPEKNLDEAAFEMSAISAKVRRMPLSYEGIDFNIAITVGVAENDYRSPLQAIFDEADRKLYIGKASGRDQVVI